MKNRNISVPDSTPSSETVQLLRKTTIFSHLTPAEIDVLANIAMDQAFPGDTVIFEEGDIANSLHILLTGKARAFSHQGPRKKVIYNEFRPGDYFGELSFIDGKPRSACVETVRPSRILTIPGDRFEAVVSCNPAICFNLMKGLTEKLRGATRQIEDLVFAVSHQELVDADLDTIHRLVLTAEFKDENTGDHLGRISRYSAALAEKAGFSGKEIHHFRHAAPIHDIGKIGIPEHILLKPGRLSAQEFEIIKTHTVIGARILSNPHSDIMKMALDIARWHHERFDGEGYPDRLEKEEIPVTARIVAIVDTFDALTSKRPYKSAYPDEIAVDLMGKESGHHFDPELFTLFMDHLEEMIAIKNDMTSPGDPDAPRNTPMVWSERDGNTDQNEPC